MADNIPKPSRNRSRRLRKKLHIEEFKEFCFVFEFTAKMSSDAVDKFTDDLISLVEDNGLSCFSSSQCRIKGEHNVLFYAHISPSSCRGCSRYGCKPGQPVTASHLLLFRNFIEANVPDVNFIQFSELKDLWYSDEE